MKGHAKSGSLGPYGFRQEYFKDVFPMATRIFTGIKCFERNPMRTMAGSFL